MPKIKVLYIHQDGLVTGSAISLKYFLSAVDREIYQPIVLLAEEGPARLLYEELGIDVYVYTYTRLWTFPGPNWYSRASFKQYKALFSDTGFYKKVQEINPDIIHINDKAAVNAGISLKKLGKPIVQHSRSSYVITASPISKYLNVNIILKKSDAVIAISEDEVDGLQSHKNLHVINNTVHPNQVENAVSKRDETRESLGIKPDDILIGLVGLVNAKKGAWHFLDLANKLTQKYPDKPIKFIMVGKVSEDGNTVLNDGSVLKKSPKKYIEDYLDTNNLNDKVMVTGFRSDALQIMAALEVLIVANNNAVMGRQPIEAQALGVPVIVAQGHSGKSTILINGEGGIVIDSPVKIEKLVDAVDSLINNPELRKTMGEKGKVYAKAKFTPETNMRKIEAIYQKLLSAKQA